MTGRQPSGVSHLHRLQQQGQDMLKIYIIDDLSGDDHSYQFYVDLHTNWFDIQQAVRLFYPTAKMVTFETMTEEDALKEQKED